MKKSVIVMTALMMTGCATSGSQTATNTAAGIGMNVFQTAVKQKCQNELVNHQYWKIASLAMSEQMQSKVSDNVCSCVSEKGPQTVSLTEVATAAIDPTARTQVVSKAVVGSLQACMADYLSV